MTDAICSDVPAMGDGSPSAQTFVGCDSHVVNLHGMNVDKQFINTLMDETRKRGAMDKLISDRAQVKISDKVKDML